ncbi:hypothetical protein EV175_003085 [Coemansia sp. RSA 1933]|nr:hypothetical protein EV175_003085 [Coemansia sp. RSA 1933]
MREAARPLRQALENAPSMLPSRYDWRGNSHTRRYDELVREFPHVSCTELLRMVQAISSSDSAALLTAGGTVLGRTCTKRARDPTAGALSSKLRRRVCSVEKPFQRQTRLPLSVFASFKKLVRCHGHKFPTYCVLFDRTSRRMITGSDDYLVKVWCTQSGYLINTFKGHHDVITDVVLNVENTLLASASTDGTVRIWNLKTGEPRAVLIANPHGRTKGITAVKFSPSPRKEIRFLATTCDDGLCRLYRWDNQTLTFDTNPIVIDGRPEPRHSVTCFAFNHTGSRFAIATSTGYVSIYSTIANAGNVADDSLDWGTPKLITRIAAHDDSITTLVFSEIGEMFLTGSADGTVKIWKCTGVDLTWTSTSIDIKEPIPGANDSPEIVLHNQQADLFRPPPPVQPIQQAAEAQNVADNSPPLHPQQQRRNSLAAGIVRAAEASDAASAEPQHIANTEPQHAANTEPPTHSEEGAPGTTTEPAPDSNDTDLAPMPLVKRVETHQVAWVCDSSRVIISNNIGTVVVFDLETGKERWRRRAHSVAEVFVLITHPTDPRIAVSGGYDGRAIMWNVDTGDILHEFQVGEQIFDGSFSEDGLKFGLSTETGAVTLFGLGPSWAFEDANKMPEQMFDSDYTATIMDENHFVADQQTQIPSYLVPHSALMDFDGRVYRIQRGPRFGLGIETGVDAPKFQREEAARMKALDVELDHAYLDYRAAQAPVSEIHSRRRGRRRGATLAADTQPATIEEVLDMPIIIPIDDSDDEEYEAGLDEEEEEDYDNVDGEEEEEGPRSLVPGQRSHRRTTLSSTRSGGDDAHDAYATNTRGRRTALELLRNRHGSADDSRTPPASPWRSARRTIAEEDDDVDVMDVDDDYNGSAPTERVGTRANRRTIGREPMDSDTSQEDERPRRGAGVRRRLRINVLYESETVTSDDDFQPRSAVPAATHTGRPRGRPPRRRRNTATTQHPASLATDVAAGTQRQTRSRRVAIDSDEDEVSDRSELDVDIDGLSVSDNEYMSSQVATSRPTRRHSSTARQSARDSGGPQADRGRRNTANGYSLRRANAARNSDSDEYNMTDGDAEDHALTRTRSDMRNSQMRVPRTSEDAGYSDNDSSFGSDSGVPRGLRTGRQTKRRGQQPQQQAAQQGHNNSALGATSSYAPNTNIVHSEYRPTDWVLATSHSTVPYRPQIGDIVVYFREGHQDFWNSPLRCKKLNDKLLPFVVSPSLPVAVYGKVVGLHYAVGPPTFCTVRIQMLQNQTIDEMDTEVSSAHELTRRSIQVQYHDCEGVPDFIILYSRYRASLRSPLKSGDSVSVLFDEDQAHRATITEFRDIKPTSRATNVTRLIARNPWKSITVEWAGAEGVDGESKTEQVSPWELVHDDDTADAEIPDTIKQSLLGVVSSLRSDARFVWFVRNVDYVTEYPDYLLNIAYPMCLDTVYERISKGFYRHMSAVSFDMELIRENADTFNDPGTPVPVAAQQLVDMYVQLLDHALEEKDKSSVEEEEEDKDSVVETDSDGSTRLRRLPSNDSQEWDGEAIQSSPPPVRPSRLTRRTLRRSSPEQPASSVNPEASEESEDDGPQLRTRKRKTRSTNNHAASSASRKRRAPRRSSSTRNGRQNWVDSDDSDNAKVSSDEAASAKPTYKDSDDDSAADEDDDYDDDDNYM